LIVRIGRPTLPVLRLRLKSADDHDRRVAAELLTRIGPTDASLSRARAMLARRLAQRGVTLPASALALLVAQKATSAAVPASLLQFTVDAARLVVAGSTLASIVSPAVTALTNGVLKAMLIAKLKTVALAVLLLAFLGAAGVVGFEAAGGHPLEVLAGGKLAKEPEKKPGSDADVAKEAKGDAGRPMDRDDPLPAQSTARLGTARYRHGSRIESMAVSADGKLAVTASGYGSFNPALAGKFSPARVFDLTDGRCLYSLPNEFGAYTEAVSLSPDGKTLAVKDDKFLYFHDAATGKELRKVKYLPDSGGGRSMPNWMTFTPDGKQIAATLMGTAMHLIDVETGESKKTFDTGEAVGTCVFSSDGKLMATGGYKQENGVYYSRLWDASTGKELRRFAIVGQLAFSHDGTKLAGAALGDGRLRLFEVATGKELKVFPKIGEYIRGIAFAPDDKTVAAAGDSIHLYDPVTGKERLQVDRLQIDRKAKWLVFSRDLSVVTGAVNGAIYRWDASSGRQLTPAPCQDSAVEQILVSADSRSLFTTDQEGDLYRWDIADKKPLRRIAEGVKRGVVTSSDRRFLAWADGEGRIRLYDVAADRFIDRVKLFGETVVAFLPDTKTLLTLGGEPAAIQLWDIESGKQRSSFAVAAKSDAKRPRAAPAEDRGVPVRLWDVTAGKAGRELSEPMNVLAVPDEPNGGASRLGFYEPFYTTRWAALSPNGKTLAIGPDWAASFGNRDIRSPDGRAFSPDGRLLVDWAENPFGRGRMDHVYVWEAATGRAVATLTSGPRPGAANAAFAPDGRTLATASADGIIRLWETTTWKVRAEFRGHRDKVTALAFGPDGRLFTGGLDTVVLAWDVRPPQSPAKGTLADAWDALASADAGVGFQAQGRFLAEPAKAAEWFAARVPPAVRADPARVKALIADLENQSFAVRTRATENLKELWPETAAALREVVAKPSSLEVRRRAEGIIQEMTETVPPARLRALRAAEVLEWIATKEARTLLLELAKGAPDAQLTRETAAACKRLESRK